MGPPPPVRDSYVVSSLAGQSAVERRQVLHRTIQQHLHLMAIPAEAEVDGLLLAHAADVVTHCHGDGKKTRGRTHTSSTRYHHNTTEDETLRR